MIQQSFNEQDHVFCLATLEISLIHLLLHLKPFWMQMGHANIALRLLAGRT